jgi:peptidoglycan hydrolase-like protein with peptidoglycan-binding domain
MYADGRDFITARNIQSMLTDLGYSVGKIDGIIGKKTMDAVYRFETDYDMYHAKGISADVVRKLLELSK